MKQALGGRARGPLHPTAVITKGRPQTTTQPASPAAGSSRPKAATPRYRARLRGGEGYVPRAVVRWSPPKGHRGSPTGQIWGPRGDFASGEQGCRRPQAGHEGVRDRAGPGASSKGFKVLPGKGQEHAQGSGPAGHRGQGQLGTGVRAGWAQG